METNCKTTDLADDKVNSAEKKVAELEARIDQMKIEAENIKKSLEHNLIKQVEILAIFKIFISILVTNVIGIDIVSSMRLRGLALLDMACVVSELILLLGIKFIVINSNKK